MNSIRHLIFDFDGTLADTAPLIISTMQAAIAEMKLPERTVDECRATIGLRLEEIPAVLWPGMTGLSSEYAATYRRIFEQLSRPLGVKCYPGVLATLHELHAAGYGMAVATSRSHRSVVEYLEGFGIAGLFPAIVGGEDVAVGKPAPDAVLAICDSMGWNREEAMVIGDTVFDIMMGRNAGARTCGVTYGNQTAVQLAEASPEFIIDSFTCLTEILK